eukprot:1155922-Pelagomonas_calceolata.AAC.1
MGMEFASKFNGMLGGETMSTFGGERLGWGPLNRSPYINFGRENGELTSQSNHCTTIWGR